MILQLKVASISELIAVVQLQLAELSLEMLPILFLIVASEAQVMVTFQGEIIHIYQGETVLHLSTPSPSIFPTLTALFFSLKEYR